MTSGQSAILKIPYGISKGRLVHISKVARGLSCDCVCPVCKAVLIARRGPKVRQHFAHYRPTTCKPETVVHHIGKMLLRDRIQAALDVQQELHMRWGCAHCDDVHEGNLLRKVRSVSLEHDFGSCRPDIALFKRSGKPIAFIEVIVTHPPEENLRRYCHDHLIELLQCHLKTEQDLEQITTSSPLEITRGSYCPRMRCSNCGARFTTHKLHLVTAKCYHCKRDMAIAFASDGRVVRGPDEFSDYEVAAACRHGVVLRRKHSGPLNSDYIANVCSRCGAFIGQHFMPGYMDWKAPAVCWNCRRAPQTPLSGGPQTADPQQPVLF